MTNDVENAVPAAPPTTGEKADLAARFTRVYRENAWDDAETRSGPGSRRDSETVAWSLKALTLAYDTYGVRSIADIPCGDFNWIGPFLDARPDLAYTGYDIVADLVRDNTARHPGRRFRSLDITSEDFARADLVFCKDLFIHLTFADVGRAIGRMKASGSTWLLASNIFGMPNNDLPSGLAGEAREVDLVAPPLNYPAPVWRTHYLGLWRLAEM